MVQWRHGLQCCINKSALHLPIVVLMKHSAPHGDKDSPISNQQQQQHQVGDFIGDFVSSKRLSYHLSSIGSGGAIWRTAAVMRRTLANYFSSNIVWIQRRGWTLYWQTDSTEWRWKIARIERMGRIESYFVVICIRDIRAREAASSCVTLSHLNLRTIWRYTNLFYLLTYLLVNLPTDFNRRRFARLVSKLVVIQVLTLNNHKF